MNLALQNALTGLISVLSLYLLLAVVTKAMSLFFEIKAAFNRRKEMELFAETLGRAMKQDRPDSQKNETLN